MSDLLAAVDAGLAELGSLDLDGVSGDGLNELVLGLQRLRARLDAAEARVLSRWDAQQVWAADGARGGAAWLAWRQRLPVQVTRQRIHHARALREFPEILDAWAAGEIDRAHVKTLLEVRTPRTQAAFATDHPVLLEAARLQRFVDFRRTCDRWTHAVDPDGAEDNAGKQHADRAVHLSQSFGGMWLGQITLAPIAGTIVHDTLRMIEHELFETDWATTRDRLGRDPLLIELPRTPAQRRADALVEMAIRARTAPAHGRRPAPLFTVLVGYETFAGPILELANRTLVTPGTLIPWLSEADLERIVFDGPSRIIDVGVTQRFYRGGLRRAIEVRDRTCYHPTCGEIPEHPQIDHIHQAATGGPTTQDNGRLACAFHNRQRNTHPDPDDPDPPRS